MNRSAVPGKGQEKPGVCERARRSCTSPKEMVVGPWGLELRGAGGYVICAVILSHARGQLCNSVNANANDSNGL